MRREAYDVFKELEAFANKIKDQFEHRREAWQEAASERSAGFPSVTVSYDNDAVYVDADLPGVRKSDVTVAMRGGDAIEVSGRRDLPPQAGRESVLKETRSGEFRRVIELPDFVEIAVDQVSATMEDGVLKIRLPRRDAAQRRTVEIL